MKTYTYTEFVRFDKSFTKEKNDFYGNYSPLDESGTKEFFSEYLEKMKKEYGEDLLERKAVSKEELTRACSLLKREDGLRFTASKRRHKSGYKLWQLYTDRATVEADTVILNDGYALPTAAAKCEFGSKIKKLVLTVYFDEEYRRPIPGGAIITTPGKSIDLRCGITDAVRLFFAEDGKLIVRYDKNGDVYHFADKTLCEYPFGKSFDIEFELLEDSFTVSSMGESVGYPYLIGPRPDTLFISGGLQPTSIWKVRVKEAVDVCGENLDVFEKESVEYPEEDIGSVTLPFAIGTEKDKDKELILRSSFIAEEGLSYALRIEALDPSGDVYLNGSLVCSTSSFDPFTLSLDGHIKAGENSLEIRIMPRAPELLYVWHRHKDPYNGWFSLSVKLISGKKTVESRPVIEALGKCAPESIKVSWNTELCGETTYKAYIRPSFPKEGEYTELSSGKLSKGKLNFTNSCIYKLWSVDEPNLYEIKIDLFEGEEKIFSDTVETGFRTIVQRDGAIYLNGEKI